MATYHPLCCRRRHGDVLMARLRDNTAPRRCLPCVKRWAGALLRSQGPTHGAGRQRLLYPRRGRRLPPDGCRLLHRHPPARPPAESHRGDTRRCLDADSLLDGRRRRCGRDHLHPVPGRGGRRAGTAHRPAGEAGARFSTGSLRHLQLSRLHHRPRRGDAGTGGRSSPSTPRSRMRYATSSTAWG